MVKQSAYPPFNCSECEGSLEEGYKIIKVGGHYEYLCKSCADACDECGGSGDHKDCFGDYDECFACKGTGKRPIEEGVLKYQVLLEVEFDLESDGPRYEHEIPIYIQAGIDGFERDGFCIVNSHSTSTHRQVKQ